MNKKVILITGASSGIGFDTALKLARQGHRVYGAARRVEVVAELEQYGVKPVRMDITQKDDIVAAVDTIIRNEGRIDVLVNNAGYGYLGAIENVSLDNARRQLEVNLFGLAQLTQLVLPYMRKQHSGRIINISSIAGKAAVLFGGWYNVSKFALEAFSDTLRIETRPFGIDVSIVEPSGIKTEWGIIAADNLEDSSRGSAYEKASLNMAAKLRKAYTGNLLSPPKSVTKSIVKAVNARRTRSRYRAGAGARTFIVLHTLLPTRWWDAMVGILAR